VGHLHRRPPAREDIPKGNRGEPLPGNVGHVHRPRRILIITVTIERPAVLGNTSARQRAGRGDASGGPGRCAGARHTEVLRQRVRGHDYPAPPPGREQISNPNAL
jgi:hypothetical protein